jgi:UDP-N-acetylmuramyl pentapeptide synthase
MSGARTVRDALLLQAFGELDTLLCRVELLDTQLNASSDRVRAALAALEPASAKYSAELAQLTDETKKALVEYIERRASASTADAMASHRKAMQEAATLAFADQLASPLRDIARQLDQRCREDSLTLRPINAFWLAAAVLSAGALLGASATYLMR